MTASWHWGLLHGRGPHSIARLRRGIGAGNLGIWGPMVTLSAAIMHDGHKIDQLQE